MGEYVLLKRGLYWRPNSQGYTGVLAEAGRYTEAEAKAHARDGADGVTMQLAGEAEAFSPKCWPETQIKVLAAENARLREALAFYADEQNYRMNAPLDPNSGRFEGNTRARAALTPTT